MAEVLRSDRITQGPTIEAFERALAERVGADEAVLCSNGTAALHLTMLALGIGPGDAILTTPVTFLADANCARYVGADVVFADIDPMTGLVNPDAVENTLANDQDHRIKAIVPVHFAGQPADMPMLRQIAEQYDVLVVEDGCHAISAAYEYDGTVAKVGGCHHSDMTVFSFHPVKHVAMGEGGAVTTNSPEIAERLRLFRNHGMQKGDFICPEQGMASDETPNPWYYEMQELGYNYRATDIQAALGLSQLNKLDWSIQNRQELAAAYTRLIQDLFPDGGVVPLANRPDQINAYHLFVSLIDFDRFGKDRATVMNELREAGIGTQVHYIPLHLQPYYRRLYNHRMGDFPHAEAYYRRALSLPMFPDLTDTDAEYVVKVLAETLRGDA